MEPEAEALIIKARESLEVANIIRERGYPDFAASRAYYAMFYAVEAPHAADGRFYSSHGAAIGAYGREFAKTGRLDPKYHRWIIRAEFLRTAGDYTSQRVVTTEQCREMCDWAKEFIEVAEHYLKKGQALD